MFLVELLDAFSLSILPDNFELTARLEAMTEGVRIALDDTKEGGFRRALDVDVVEALVGASLSSPDQILSRRRTDNPYRRGALRRTGRRRRCRFLRASGQVVEVRIIKFDESHFLR